MDASPITLGLLGAGVLLVWSALANRSPLSEVKAALGVKGEGNKKIAEPTPKSTFTPYGGVPLGTADGGAGIGGASTFRRWEDIVAYVKPKVPGVEVGSTTGPGHSTTGQHPKGKAVDFPGSPGTVIPDHELNRVMDVLRPLAQSGALLELYYRDEAWRAGRSVARVPKHDNHVHASTP